MDPKDQFKEKYNSYVAQRNQQVGADTSSPTPNISPKKHSFSPNRFYVLGIIAGILIIGPAAAFLMLSSRINQTAAPSQISSVDQPVQVAQPVTEAQIDAEMQQIWGQYYQDTKNDPKLREIAKQNIIHSRIVQQGLTANNVQLSSIASSDPLETQQLAETALMQKVLNSRNVDYAFVFISPSSKTYAADKKKATYSYNLLKTYMKQGKTMQEAYVLAKTDPGFFKPITITTNKLVYENSFDKTISKKLFTYKQGEVTDIIDSGGGTFIVADINSVHSTPYATMNDWVAAQKK